MARTDAIRTHATRDPAPELRRVLSGLRWRIRAYVLAEGAAAAAAWLALTFWCFLAIDYLPVVAWASELPRPVRAVGLAVIAAILARIVFRAILSRIFTRLRDRSMAILLERRFPAFQDSLVTAVEIGRTVDGGFSPEMLDATRREALTRLPSVRLRDVFRGAPLFGKLAVAAALAAPIVAFAALREDLFELSLRRFYLMSDEPWPRNAEIEIVGIDIERLSPKTGERSYSEHLPFTANQVKVARGAAFSLQVRANANRKLVPQACRVHYRLSDGTRGQVAMRRDGAPRDGYQYYSFAGKPFQGILDDVRFDVVGNDHRLRDYAIRVVETPAVVSTVLRCEFPEYLVDRENGLWLPREIEYRSSGTQLPAGTKVTVTCVTNKALLRADLSEPSAGSARAIDFPSDNPATTFSHSIETLTGNVAIDITLRDTDNVLSGTAHRILLAAVPDTAPRIEVAMRGIGSAVTSDVMVPAIGAVRDDHAVDESWFDVRINDQREFRHVFPLNADGAVDTMLDFRDLKLTRPEAAIQAGDRLLLAVKASDHFNLDGGSNVGQGERLELEVVTPDELLIRLDRRELAERRRFEHIIEETTQMRDSLVRVRNEIEGITPGSDPAETRGAAPEGSESADPAAKSEPKVDLRGIRTQQALRQCQKSAAEVLGVSAAFLGIRDELIHNRVDSEDRKARLKDRVADPLAAIGEQSFPRLEADLAALEKSVAARKDELSAAERAITQANALLVQLEGVLADMLDIESYNELIEIVRNLIDEQQRLMDETRKARKQDALDLLK
ncbi:MAG: hypothetical protein FJ297_04915 [Planctomycetes bacterium]|nr:hypothetical protein [Planctomycetota bacterium]